MASGIYSTWKVFPGKITLSLNIIVLNLLAANWTKILILTNGKDIIEGSLLAFKRSVRQGIFNTCLWEFGKQGNDKLR